MKTFDYINRVIVGIFLKMHAHFPTRGAVVGEAETELSSEVFSSLPARGPWAAWAGCAQAQSPRCFHPRATKRGVPLCRQAATIESLAHDIIRNTLGILHENITGLRFIFL